MQEVKIRLCFISPCLGYAPHELNRRNDVIYCMPRDSQGRVIFLASWWRSLMTYAAKVVGICYDDVHKIDWANQVDGHVTEWRRIVAPAAGRKKARYALHEAFRPGAEIGINAVLPSTISIDDFVSLLNTAGSYRGISPYQSQEETYGTFEVLSVMPTIRQKHPTSRRETEKHPTS